MKELAAQIMNVCRGHAMHEALDALDFVRKWVEAEAFVPTRGIKNPARDMTTGRIMPVILRFTFPLFVRENLFAEALCVLILGIILSSLIGLCKQVIL